MEWWGWLLVAAGGAAAALALLHVLTRPRRFPLGGKVVVITGGSSGIGKAVAREALKRGAHVALLARREDVLKQAREELSPQAGPGQRISVHPVDVTSEAATRSALEAVAAAHGGRVDVLVCSAGTSNPREFESMSGADFEAVLRLNVLGTRHAIAAALPHMRHCHVPSPAAGGAAPEGRIVLVSSQAGQVGLYGYTAYSASKFALMGLAQSLGMELWTRRIRVSVSFPPDTDTPLLASENLTKPHITKLLSEASATVAPEVVARGLVDGVVRWAPVIPVGFDGWMLATVTAGMGPAGSVASAVAQVATMGLWRLVGLFYVSHFYRVIGAHDKAA